MTKPIFRSCLIKSHASVATIALTLLALPNAALAQSTEGSSAGEIVVTGSRVTRDGYNAPTPVTVLGADLLNKMANSNIADSLNALPQFSTSVTQTSQVGGFSGGTMGVNNMNLRGLGAQRTLILQDGKRIINSSIVTQFSAPDINTIPNDLVSRVDVVTGGASAAYGSDALSGVVNFVLDHNFTGIKGKVQGGITTYGDNAEYALSLTVGSKFGPEGRGHILASVETTRNAGVSGNYRPWEAGGGSVFTNPGYTPTNGQPFYLVGRNIGLSNGTQGGLITSGPLRGISFGPGGTPVPFNFGLVSGNNVMQGGDWRVSRIDQIPDLVVADERVVAYGRLSYDLSDKFQVYAEYQYAGSTDSSHSVQNIKLGNVTVKADNAFIPTTVATQLAALGQPSFLLGTANGDIGQAYVVNKRALRRWAFGATGNFDVLGSNWKWDGYIQESTNTADINTFNSVNNVKFAQAVDAVRNPTTGAIVCRSTPTNPGDGCVPYNVMGIGVNSQGAINYVTGVAHLDQKQRELVGAINLHGEPFSTWAGPVSVAFGIEHRRESVTGLATAADEANQYVWGNYHATPGAGNPPAAYNVTEGYIETVVPLAKNLSWAKSLDLNGAVRETSYSTSGRVTTWKAGATYAPTDDIRFRFVQSRDIRAPNLGELFGAGQANVGNPFIDRFNGTTVTPLALSKGNINLQPEVAQSTGAGVVFTPSFLHGFQASVDYYRISIDQAVTVPTAQVIIDLCYAGNQTACGLITRTNGVITQVQTSPANVQSQTAEGLDMDVSYRFPLSNIWEGGKGEISIRAVGTYVLSMKQVTNTTTIQGAGSIGYYGVSTSFSNVPPFAPKWKHDLFVTYANDPLTATLTWHYTSPGKYNQGFTECTASCPLNSVNTISDNHIGSASTFDLAFTYKPFEDRNVDLFLTIDNIFNQDPPFIGGNVGFTYAIGQYNYMYDRIGRTFQGGVRFKF